MSLELGLALFALATGAGALLAVHRRVPRADRDWAPDHAVPAQIHLTPEDAKIQRLRDFRHRTTGVPVEAYRDEVVALDDVRRVWLVVAHFSRAWRGLAHVLLSFELAGGRYIAISIEARRRRGQPYSIIGGFLRRFEVTYVVGTESDLLGARAVAGERLHLYPIKAEPEQARALFLDMLLGAEARRRFPAFYHTVAHNCATVLREHVNRVLPDRLPFGRAVIFPGYADGVALARGLLDTDLPLESARTRFRVDERVRLALDAGRQGGELSTWIRQREPESARRP